VSAERAYRRAACTAPVSYSVTGSASSLASADVQTSSALKLTTLPIGTAARRHGRQETKLVWSRFQASSCTPPAAPQGGPALTTSPFQLTLINISDHHTRTMANTPDGVVRPVLGMLLGIQTGRTVDISNSFEIKYSMVADNVEIDDEYLLRKLDQCKSQRYPAPLSHWRHPPLTVGRVMQTSRCSRS
jgi:hypothetical protein